MSTEPMTLDRMLAIIETVDAWLDDAVSGTYKDQPLAQDWARVAKVAEEAGEAVSALIACSGQNPRKGVNGTREDLHGELADVICAGLAALMHLTKDPAEVKAILTASLEKVEARAAGWSAGQKLAAALDERGAGWGWSTPRSAT